MSEEHWQHKLAYAIDMAYARIDRDPQSLLETDGGPVGATASIVVARLYGHDGQIDREIRLTEALRIVEVPIPRPLHLMASPPGPHESIDPLRTARYNLQSGWAEVPLDPMWAPPDMPRDPMTDLVTVLCLRYKREPISGRAAAAR